MLLLNDEEEVIGKSVFGRWGVKTKTISNNHDVYLRRPK